MPELARFYGISIRMFVERSGQHHEPHFHAYYQRTVASYRIDMIQILAGELPIRQQCLVEAWAELHTQELLDNWQPLQNDQTPVKIAPLR